MDGRTALQKAGFTPKVPHSLRQRTHINLDTSQYTSNYIPPPEVSEYEKEKKEVRKNGTEDLSLKIRALLGLMPSYDVIQCSLEEGLIERWEGGVWDASANEGDVFDDYETKIKQEVELMDWYVDLWEEDADDAGNTGCDLFREDVRLCMEDGDEVAFISPPEAFSNHSAPSDKEAALNADKFREDQLSKDDKPRWLNRRDFQKALREMIKWVPDKDELKRLDIIQFASALETKEWENEAGSDESYDDRILGVAQDLDNEVLLWDSEEADETNNFTGCQLFRKRVYQEFGGRFIRDTSLPQQDSEQGSKYDDTDFYGDDNADGHLSPDGDASAMSSDHKDAGGLGEDYIEGGDDIKLSPVSPTLPQQGPSGSSCVAEDYPNNAQTAPHYAWPPIAPQQGPAADINDAIGETSLGYGNVVFRAEADDSQDAGLRVSLTHPAADTPKEILWPLPGLLFGGATTSATLPNQASILQPDMALQAPTIVEDGDQMDLGGYEDERAGATISQPQQAQRDLQQVPTYAAPAPDVVSDDVEMGHTTEYQTSPADVAGIVGASHPQATTASSRTASSERPLLFTTNNLSFGLPMNMKSFMPQPSFVIDSGANTADLGNLKREPHAPQEIFKDPSTGLRLLRNTRLSC